MFDATLPNWLHWLDRCPSTNTWALDHTAKLQHGDVVFTPQQTSGRGQHGRVWYAPEGVLTASFILDRLPVLQLPCLSLAAGLAVIYAVEDLLPGCQNMLGLKWPNDVLCDRRKLAGILCETPPLRQSKETRVVVGIGLNRRVNFAEIASKAVLQEGNAEAPNAISLHQISASVPDELALLERLRHYLLQTAGLLSNEPAQTNAGNENSGFSKLLPEIRRRDVLLERPISIDLPTEIAIGHGAGIDDWGRLQLRLPNQQVRTFSAGRIRWE